MLKRFFLAMVLAIPSYLAGAIGGGAVVYQFSGNTHDRDMEAVMTGAFALGPAAAVVGILVVLFWPRRIAPRA